MPIVNWEQEEEYKTIIRRLIAMNPTMTVFELQRRLKTAEKPIELSRPYLTKLFQQIRQDRIKEIEDETKEDIYAQVQEVVTFVNQNLRAIAQEEKLVYTERDPKTGEPAATAKMRIFAQNNRIKALNSVIDNLIKLYNLKMDLGIIERKVGTMDHNIIDVMSALKKIRNGDYTTDLEQLVPELAAPEQYDSSESEEDRA